MDPLFPMHGLSGVKAHIVHSQSLSGLNNSPRISLFESDIVGVKRPFAKA